MTQHLDDVRHCCLDQFYLSQLHPFRITPLEVSRATMEEYIRYLHDWLAPLHPAKPEGHGTQSTQPILDPDSPQWHIIQTLRDVMESKCNPQEAAESLADIVQWTNDILRCYNNMWGCYFKAVEHFSDVEIFSKLADLLACLASLPGAINTTRDPKDPSKEPIIIDGEVEIFWKDLPEFSMNLTERMQGPEAYLAFDATPETASRTWTNINTFVAILVRNHGTAFPNLFGDLVVFAFWTLAASLVHPAGSRFGKNMVLRLPACCRWILLVGDVVREKLDQGYQGKPWTASVGELWGGPAEVREVDAARWRFWKERFEALSEDSRLDAEMADTALRVSKLM